MTSRPSFAESNQPSLRSRAITTLTVAGSTPKTPMSSVEGTELRGTAGEAKILAVQVEDERSWSHRGCFS